LHQAINTRGQATCDAWSEAEFNHMYNPLIALVKSLDAANDQRAVSGYQSQCSNQLGDLNFEFLFNLGNEVAEGIAEDDESFFCAKEAYLRVLPDTCTADKLLMDGDGCAFQVPLGPLVGMSDLSLQVAVDICPGSLLPFVSARLSGSGSDKLFAPCSFDGQCGDEYSCQDPLRSLLIASDSEWRTDYDQPAGGEPKNQLARDLLEGKFLEEILRVVLLPGGILDEISEMSGYSEEDVEMISQIMETEQITTTLATWLRSFWDDTEVSLVDGQLLPMCLPKLKTDPADPSAQLCYNPSGRVCEPQDSGFMQRNSNGNVECENIGAQGVEPGQLCVALGCEWVAEDWACIGDEGHGDAELEARCAARQVNEYDAWDQCDYDVFEDEWGNMGSMPSGCHFDGVGPPGFDVDNCVIPESPWTYRSQEFGYGGDVFQCALDDTGEHLEWTLDADKTSSVEQVLNRCISDGAGSVGVELLQIKRNILAGDGLDECGDEQQACLTSESCTALLDDVEGCMADAVCGAFMECQQGQGQGGGRRLQDSTAPSPAPNTEGGGWQSEFSPEAMDACSVEIGACQESMDCMQELESAFYSRDLPNGSAEMMAAVSCLIQGDAGVYFTSCSVATIVNFEVLQPWDGVLADGSSAFHPSLRYAEHIDTPPGGMDGTWYNWDCSGNGLVRVSDGLLLSFEAVTVQPAINVIASSLRRIWSTFAEQKGVCITDEQIQTFFLPWVPSFALSLISTWGPGVTPTDLLPGVRSFPQVIMETLFTETDRCPLDPSTVDPDCVLAAIDPNQGGQCWEGDFSCIRDRCGGDFDLSAMLPAECQWGMPAEDQASCEAMDCDGQPCAWSEESACTETRPYPSVVLPASCTAAGYASGAGCAIAYDVSADFGFDFQLEVGLQQCEGNPFGLPAVYAKCVGPQCDYGTSWCSATEPCANPSEQCFELEALEDETDCTLLHADCVEYAQVSVPADKAACDAVTALDDSAACEAVSTAADAAIGACVFIEPSCDDVIGKFREKILTTTPFDSAFVEASPFSIEADPISYLMGLGDMPGTVGVVISGLNRDAVCCDEGGMLVSHPPQNPDSMHASDQNSWQENIAYNRNPGLQPDDGQPAGLYWCE
jgi:hypothetical protein